MAWRYCGNQIKLWRTQAGISREELGKEAGYEYESVKSMEQGRRKPQLRLLEVADQMCGARGLLLAARDDLKPDKFPVRTQEFMTAEAEAIALHWYETVLIPGLLQTEEYARELISNRCPPVDDETVEERVAGRLERQLKLRPSPTTLFNFVLYEAALRTGVGSSQVMRGATPPPARSGHSAQRIHPDSACRSRRSRRAQRPGGTAGVGQPRTARLRRGPGNGSAIRGPREAQSPCTTP
ncbi:transcriptional regulator with XRE-family HTH domain [Streptomyces netropsis]|uniref:Transcriptional regulator with XRE-family HTH domain n=1 Tax=Streptomyces netropsis TaxID=55404 RepID=A0A7W7PCI3_STRNE|nr:transcriptional regulator with XRE-family HTH domain [Streptomyces netropsis]